MGLFSKINILAEAAGVGTLNDLPPVERPRTRAFVRPKRIERTELNYKIIQVTNGVRWFRERIIWRNVSKAQRDQIATFYESHNGQEIPFTHRS